MSGSYNLLYGGDPSLSDGIDAVEIDQSNRSDTYKFIEYVKSKYSTIDCIICNVGVSIRESFTESTDEDWDKMMEIVVTSHYILIRELYDMIPHRNYSQCHIFRLCGNFLIERKTRRNQTEYISQDCNSSFCNCRGNCGWF